MKAPDKSGAQLGQADLATLRLARRNGWLRLTPDVSDRVVACWQRQCKRFSRPFAVVRIEPRRASLWLILGAESEWGRQAQGRLNAAMTQSRGFVLTSNSVRAFVDRAGADALMTCLLAACES